MSVQHVSIGDGDRHEAKGASSAALKTVCMSNGDGTTSFNLVSYNDLTDKPTPTVLSEIISGFSTATSQLPTTLDTPLEVSFGSGGSTTDVTIASSGDITFNTTGNYQVKVGLSFGRTALTGVANLMCRMLINGAQVGQSFGVSLDNNVSTTFVVNTFMVSATSGNVLSFEIVRASSGIDVGGLYKVSATTSGWNDVPSAIINIYK